jgi:methionyl-tRNA formyltransferase
MDRIVLLSKRDEWSERAGQVAEIAFGERLIWLRGSVGDPLPREALPARMPWLISFLSPWIVPGAMLSAAGAAINFHPGSCDYPGIGCYNFCLYEGAATYGATCHYMNPKVDTGAVIEERCFPVLPHETVETLKFRTMVVMLGLFHDIVARISSDQPMPQSSRSWTRKPFTRAELNALATVAPGMGADEVARRVRATTYPGYPGPVLVVGDVVFRSDVPNRKPIA